MYLTNIHYLDSFVTIDHDTNSNILSLSTAAAGTDLLKSPPLVLEALSKPAVYVATGKSI